MQDDSNINDDNNNNINVDNDNRDLAVAAEASEPPVPLDISMDVEGVNRIGPDPLSNIINSPPVKKVVSFAPQIAQVPSILHKAVPEEMEMDIMGLPILKVVGQGEVDIMGNPVEEDVLCRRASALARFLRARPGASK